MAGFRNTHYKDEWEKYVGSTQNEFANGTYFEEGDGYAVYDGAQNIMGYVSKQGVFSSPCPMTEYVASFLKSAKEELVKLGLVGTMSGDKLD